MSDSNKIQAVILAGGKGTRLRPYTMLIPKPLVPIHEIPVIEIVLRQLKKWGFNNVAITLGHQAELIRAHFSEGNSLELNLSYSVEESPLGTAGPLAQLENLADNFLVLNGDLLTTLNFQELFDEHCRTDAMVTVAAHERYIPIEFGVIEGEAGRVKDYIEKPNLKYMVSMGIYAFSKKVLSYVPKGERLDFPDLVKALLAEDKQVNFYPFDGYWLDIGSGKDFERAVDEFPSMRSALLD